MSPDVDEWLRPDLTAARRAREAVRRELDGTGCEHEAALIVSELVTNAVRHGAPPVRFRLGRLPGAVRIEVIDSAQKFGPSKIDSRGLALVQRLTRCWGVTQSAFQKLVWAEIDCDGT